MPDLSALIERLEGAAGDAEKRPRREPGALCARLRAYRIYALRPEGLYGEAMPLRRYEALYPRSFPLSRRGTCALADHGVMGSD